VWSFLEQALVCTAYIVSFTSYFPFSCLPYSVSVMSSLEQASVCALLGQGREEFSRTGFGVRPIALGS
jgi:hypothetical protein